MKNLFFEQQNHKVVCYDCDPSDNMMSDEIFRIDNGCIKSMVACLESLSDRCRETARGNIVAKMIGNTIHVTKSGNFFFEIGMEYADQLVCGLRMFLYNK